jgi:DNA-binding NtrC family response regulator
MEMLSANPSQTQEEQGDGQRPVRILLFEEDAVMLAVIQDFFLSACPDFCIVNHVERLRHQEIQIEANKNNVDVVIFDVNEILLDNTGLLGSIRFLSGRSPVILITPFGSEETERQARRLGAASYLSKPFKLARLCEEVRRVVAQRSGAKAARKDLMNSSA